MSKKSYRPRGRVRTDISQPLFPAHADLSLSCRCLLPIEATRGEGRLPSRVEQP